MTKDSYFNSDLITGDGTSIYIDRKAGWLDISSQPLINFRGKGMVGIFTNNFILESLW